jgi:hypothetical protein
MASDLDKLLAHAFRPAVSCFIAEKVSQEEGDLLFTDAKRDIKALFMKLIGETNSFESANTGRVWIDPDDLEKRVHKL